MADVPLGTLKVFFEEAPREPGHNLHHLVHRIMQLEESVEGLTTREAEAACLLSELNGRVSDLASVSDDNTTKVVEALSVLQVGLGAVLAYLERDLQAVSVRPLVPYYLTSEGERFNMAIPILDDATTVIDFEFDNRGGAAVPDPTDGTETLTFAPEGAFWGAVNHDGGKDTIHITPVVPIQAGAVATATYSFKPNDGSAELTFQLVDLTVSHDTIATMVHPVMASLTTIQMETQPAAPPADGGGTANPPDDSGTTPPADGGTTTPPADGSTTTPTDAGTTPPAAGSNPPGDGATTPPPVDGTVQPQPTPDPNSSVTDSPPNPNP
jgi:hypothetical protein